MNDRTKNPRAPVFSLEQAIEFGIKIYQQARLAVIDVDVAAVALGYKDSRNGAAQTKFATLKYFGILENRGKGKIAVSSLVQDFQFAPTKAEKWKIAKTLFETPSVFKSILDQFDDTLPSDAVIRMHLLKTVGFIDPNKADHVLKTFKASLVFVDELMPSNEDSTDLNEENLEDIAQEQISESNNTPPNETIGNTILNEHNNSEHDQIPIRLPQNRKAWLTIPSDFKEDDKEWIKKQIDAIWVEE